MNAESRAGEKYYVTTPIYYVNARPHLGHVYTTTLADVLARYHRLRGDRVFFLTGTDEHAAKVAEAARQHGLTPRQWADENAAAFEQAFAESEISHDDFIRTSQERHSTRVTRYVVRLLETGDVYAGQYEGWYDAGQEEYVPENKALEYGFKSPVNKKPLVRKREKNYFFRLSRYQDRLQRLIEARPSFIEPASRRNEVLARIREGLLDVPISRTGSGDWGIRMPCDPDQTVYVWIDALFNYLTAVDTDERRDLWPADVHLIAKDILWFHAVIWPCVLMALEYPVPGQIYAHSFWIAEGQKMSKSLGNFIGLEQIHRYAAVFGVDAVRYFLAAQGPLGSTDSDFSHHKFVEVYNTDLANALGNCVSRITNMLCRYFEGRLPAPGTSSEAAGELRPKAEGLPGRVDAHYGRVAVSAAAAEALDLVRAVDRHVERTQPFKLAKDPARRDDLGTILYHCAEALRLASFPLWPIMPLKVEAIWKLLGVSYDPNSGDRSAWSPWGQLQPGTLVTKGPPLFPRHPQ